MLLPKLQQSLAGASGTNVNTLTSTSTGGLLSTGWAKYPGTAGDALLDGNGYIYGPDGAGTGNGGNSGGTYLYRSVASVASNLVAQWSLKVLAGGVSAYPTFQVRASSSNTDAYVLQTVLPSSPNYNLQKFQAGSYVELNGPSGALSSPTYMTNATSSSLKYGVTATQAVGTVLNLSLYCSTITYNGSAAVLLVVFDGNDPVVEAVDYSPSANLLANTQVGFLNYSYGGSNGAGSDSATTGVHIGSFNVSTWSNLQPPLLGPAAPSISVATASGADTITVTAPTPGINNVSGCALDASADGVNWNLGVQTLGYNASGYSFVLPTGNANYYRARAFDTLGLTSQASGVASPLSTYSGSATISVSGTQTILPLNTSLVLGTGAGGGTASGTSTTFPASTPVTGNNAIFSGAGYN